MNDNAKNFMRLLDKMYRMSGDPRGEICYSCLTCSVPDPLYLFRRGGGGAGAFDPMIEIPALLERCGIDLIDFVTAWAKLRGEQAPESVSCLYDTLNDGCSLNRVRVVEILELIS